MRYAKTILALAAAVSTFVIAASGAVPASAPAAAGLQIEIDSGGAWQPVGFLSFDKYLKGKTLELGAVPDGPVRIRLSHTGATAAHLDVVTLGNAAPVAVAGDGVELVKLAAADLDVADVTRSSLICTFAAADSLLRVVARVEPVRGAEFPFAYPLDNLYQQPADYSAFYSYRLGDRPGRLEVDGELSGEQLGEPLFRELSRTGTGHPTADTWGWVRDDGTTLYAALDFLPDNTYDGDADYAALHVSTAAGVRDFRVSVPERSWGAPGFTYTSRAGYQHKVYEIAVPLAELGISEGAGQELQLAFSAYGTAGPPQPIIDAFSEGDQSVSVATGATAGGIGSCTPACTIIAGERDIRATETSGGGGTLEVSVNGSAADRLRVLSQGGGVGSVEVVWDAVDGDWGSNAFGLYVGLDDNFSMIELGVANPGTSDATVQMTLWTDTTGTSYYTSPLYTVAAGAALSTIKIPWDAMSFSGTEDWMGLIRAMKLVVSGASPGFDVQVESVELTEGSMLPLLIDTAADDGGTGVSGSPGEAGTLTDGSMWGGERDTWVELVSGSSCSFGTVNGYKFSYDCEEGNGRMVWDGNDDDWANLSFAGAPLDVTAYSMFEMENVIGGSASLRVTLYSAADACSETTTLVNTQRFTRFALPLADFTTACAAAVDLSAVKAIVIEPSSPGSGTTWFFIDSVGFGDGTLPVELMSLSVE